MLYCRYRRSMETLCSLIYLLVLIPVCYSDIKAKNQTASISNTTAKAGNNKRWMPSFAQFMPHDMDNNMGYYENGYAGGQVSTGQEPIGSISQNYNNQDQIGGVPQEPLSYNDASTAMTNEIGLPETMNDGGGIQQDIGREGLQPNLGSEVSAFMKQEPSLDSPENFAQLEGLGDSFSSKLAESDLIGTNLQSINNALLPKASAFVGSKTQSAASSTPQAKLPLSASTLLSPGSTAGLPTPPSPSPKETPAAPVAGINDANAKPAQEATPSITSPPVAAAAKLEVSPSPIKPSTPPPQSSKGVDKMPEKAAKETPTPSAQPPVVTKPAATEAPKVKEDEHTKKADDKKEDKEEAKETATDTTHSPVSVAPTAKPSSSKADDVDSGSATSSKHTKEDTHAKKKHKIHVTATRRHNPVKSVEPEESGDGEDDSDTDDTSDTVEVNSEAKVSKLSSDDTDDGDKQEQDQRIQKLKERIKFQKSHKHKFKPLTGVERQVISAKLGGVEDTESERQANAEENKELETMNVGNSNQLNAGENRQGADVGMPSASIKQQLVSSLKQALLANVAAMIKNKVKGVGNPIEAPLQNVANQFYAKSSKATDSEDDEQGTEGAEQGKGMVEQQEAANTPTQNEANEDQKETSTAVNSDILEQDLMKVDKKKLVHVLANLMKSQKTQAGMEMQQLFGQVGAKTGSVTQNYAKQKTENGQAAAQDDQQGDDDSQDDDEDDSQDEGATQGQQAQQAQQQQGQEQSQAERPKESKQDGRAPQSLNQQQQQALMQQIKLEQEKQQQQQTTSVSESKEQQREGENEQEAAQEGKQSAKVTASQSPSQAEGGKSDQGDQEQDDEQGEQSQDDDKGQQGNEKEDSNQSQQSQSKLASELLQRIHNKVADLKKQNAENEKESERDDEADDKEKSQESTSSEDLGKKIKHGTKSRLHQKPQPDPYAQIGLEDPSNNDKLSHKSKDGTDDKEEKGATAETEVEQASQEGDDSGKERVAPKAQSSPVDSKTSQVEPEQGDDSDTEDSSQQGQAHKSLSTQGGDKEITATTNTQLQEQILKLQQQALLQKQEQQLHGNDVAQASAQRGGKHHTSRHLVNIQKFIGGPAVLNGHLLSKSRPGLGQGEMKNQVEDIYATIGSFDPNVRKKKHKISKINQNI